MESRQTDIFDFIDKGVTEIKLSSKIIEDDITHAIKQYFDYTPEN